MDPSMAAMQNLPQDQQAQLMQAIEQMQVRDRCAHISDYLSQDACFWCEVAGVKLQ